MFKKKQFRRRVGASSDEEGDDGGGTEKDEEAGPGVKVGSGIGASGPTKASAKSSTSSGGAGSKHAAGSKAAAGLKPKGPSLLSFGGDEEDDDGEGGSGFKLKKEKKKNQASSSGMAGLSLPGASHSLKDRKEGAGLASGSARGGPDAALSGPSNIVPQTGEYTKERLAELAKNTLTIAAPRKARDSSAPVPASQKASLATPRGGPAGTSKPGSSEPVILLKGLLKPTDSGTGTGGIASASGASAGLPAQPASLGMTAGRVPPVSSFSGGGVPGGAVVIPDARAIAAAKAKRERMRQAHNAPEFIPVPGGDRGGGTARDFIALEGAGAEGGGEGARKKEEEGSSEDEEENMTGRMAFVGGPESGARNGGRKGPPGSRGSGVNGKPGGAEEGEEEEEGEGGEEEEEEAKRWEEEQLRKGVGKAALPSQGGAKATSKAGGKSKGGGIPSADELDAVEAGAAAGGPRSPVDVAGPLVQVPAGSSWGYGRQALPQAVDDGASVMKFLHDSLARAKETQSRADNSVRQAELQLAQTADTVLELEGSMEAAEKKYAFVQELKQYIRVLCDFLQDKAALIEELEEHMQRVQEDRAGAVADRRRADDADELAEAEAATSAAMAAMAQGAGTVTAAEAARAAVAALDEVGEKHKREVDEFGRDVGLQRRMEAQRRKQRRERRRAQARLRREGAGRTSGAGSEGAQGPGPQDSDVASVSQGLENQHLSNGSGSGSALRGSGSETGGGQEGEESSAESEGEATAYESQRREVILTADSVFADAVDEFGKLESVKEKLEGWKRAYPGSYRDAYASLSVPSLFAPYVRLQLLNWDPLFVGGGFDNMNWYDTLFDYGLPPNGAPTDPDDADPNLVPRLVELVALPLLDHLVARCWDPLSARASGRVVRAVEEVLIYVEASNEGIQRLLRAAEDRMGWAVQQCEVPAWAPPVLAACPGAAQLARVRFGRALRLMRNILLWRTVAAPQVLSRLLLTDLFQGALLPHLRALVPTLTEAVSRSARIVSILGPVFKGNSPLQDSEGLRPLVEYIDILGRSMESKLKAGGRKEDLVPLARQVRNMFVALDEYDKARGIAKLFSLKEAL